MARQSKKQIAARPDTAVQGGPGGTARLSPASAPADLEAILGHRFRHPELLTLALTHRSYVYDSGSAGLDAADPSHDNEQLEFVGDAVLGLLAAELLCERYPALREGELTRLRASVVSSRHLGAVGARLGLGPWLRLGHTAEKNNARSNAALFANTVEALIAAIYQDGGLKAARRFVADQILLNALPDALPGTPSGVKSGVKSGASSSTTSGAPADPERLRPARWRFQQRRRRPQVRPPGNAPGPGHGPARLRAP